MSRILEMSSDFEKNPGLCTRPFKGVDRLLNSSSDVKQASCLSPRLVDLRLERQDASEVYLGPLGQHGRRPDEG